MSQTSGVKLGITYGSALLTATAETAVLSVIFHNTTATTRMVTLNSYKSGGASGTAADQIAVIYINGYNTFTYSGDEKLLIDTGDVLEAKCDAAAAVNAKVCYKVIG